LEAWTRLLTDVGWGGDDARRGLLRGATVPQQDFDQTEGADALFGRDGFQLRGDVALEEGVGSGPIELAPAA